MNSRFTLHEYGNQKDDDHLSWKRGYTRTVFSSRIFDVNMTEFTGPGGRSGEFVQIDSADWVNIAAIHSDSAGRPCLVMVRQYRPGSDAVAVEMPGGLVDPGEEPLAAAMRELAEETGFQAGSMTHIGSANPNAAFMRNTMHCFVAQDLDFVGERNLDENEVIDVVLVPIDMLAEGKVPEFMVNGIMAVAWYFLSVWMKNGGAG